MAALENFDWLLWVDVHESAQERPFRHLSSDILPGESADFLLQTPFDPDVEVPLTDHGHGSQAQFWLRVAART